MKMTGMCKRALAFFLGALVVSFAWICTSQLMYPRIIDDKMYQQANKLKTSKYIDIDENTTTINKSIKRKAVCYLCGSPMKREKVGNNKYRRFCWRCTNDSCNSTGILLSEEKMYGMITEKLNMLIADITMAGCEYKQCEPPITEEIIKMNNEINNALSSENADKDNVKRIIYTLAVQKFNACQNNEQSYKTQNIQKILCCHTTIEMPAIQLIEGIIKNIIISENDILIKLINEKVI